MPYICSYCGHNYDHASDVYIDQFGTIICCDCRSKFLYCELCGRYMPRSSNDYQETRIGITCNTCIDSGAYNEYFSEYDRKFYREYGSAINNYSYKPRPRFVGKTNNARYFGLELEVSLPTSNNITDRFKQFTAFKLVDSLNRFKNGNYCHEKFAYCKNDATCDLEIVTHPHTKERIYETMHKICAFLNDTRFKSENMHEIKSNSCGLHIHVSKNAFWNEFRSFTENIGKIIYFFEKCQNNVFIFSRRNYEDFNEWCRIPSSYNSDSMVDRYYFNRSRGRHIAINCQPENTIEFRIFEGTIDEKKIFAAVEFIDCLIDFTKPLKSDDLIGLAKNNELWGYFLQYVDQTDNEYLKEYLSTLSFEYPKFEMYVPKYYTTIDREVLRELLDL